MPLIPTGSVIGILGGGQLGRMTSLAAARLGYRCHVYCQSADEPAAQVTDRRTVAGWQDRAALESFAKSVDIVTLEWENIPVETIDFLAERVPVHPSEKVLKVSQDREQEKAFARSIGVGTADFRIARSASELVEAIRTFPLPAILKSTRMGYDGKGQVRLNLESDPIKAWDDMGGEVGLLESFVDFACEVSVIVARQTDGTMASYPPVENIHRDGILAETRAPARIAPEIGAEATALARRMAEELDVVGLLAVETFVLKQPNAQGKRVLMNEIAPRPHNSGHWTIDACACSQYEQLVRAVCGLPLGSPEPHSRAIMRNLIGREVERWPELLQDPKACLHLYGKREIRDDRKMGHVTLLEDRA